MSLIWRGKLCAGELKTCASDSACLCSHYFLMLERLESIIFCPNGELVNTRDNLVDSYPNRQLPAPE